MLNIRMHSILHWLLVRTEETVIETALCHAERMIASQQLVAVYGNVQTFTITRVTRLY